MAARFLPPPPQAGIASANSGLVRLAAGANWNIRLSQRAPVIHIVTSNTAWLPLGTTELLASFALWAINK